MRDQVDCVLLRDVPVAVLSRRVVTLCVLEHAPVLTAVSATHPVTHPAIVDPITGRQYRCMAPYEVGRFLADDPSAQIAQLIESLPQGGRRWHLIQSQRQAEKRVVAKRFDRFEIGLAQRQQADHRTHHVAVRNLRSWTTLQGNRVHPIRQATAAQHTAHQRQSRVRRQRFISLRNNKIYRPHRLTSGVNRILHQFNPISPRRTALYTPHHFTDSG